MNGERPAASDDPICPACSKPIFESDAVVYSHGDLIHANCGADVAVIAERVEELLRVDPGRWLCEPCVATRLRVDGIPLARAVLALRVRSRIHTGVALCAGCSELRPALRDGRQPR